MRFASLLIAILDSDQVNLKITPHFTMTMALTLIVITILIKLSPTLLHCSISHSSIFLWAVVRVCSFDNGGYRHNVNACQMVVKWNVTFVFIQHQKQSNCATTMLQYTYANNTKNLGKKDLKLSFWAVQKECIADWWATIVEGVQSTNQFVG